MDKLSCDPPKFSIVKWQSYDVIEFSRDRLPPTPVPPEEWIFRSSLLDGTPAGSEEVDEFEKDPPLTEEDR